MTAASPPRKPTKAGPRATDTAMAMDMETPDLLASARRLLDELLATGDSRAAEALAALARPPCEPARPMSYLLARLGSSLSAPSTPEWIEAFEEARHCDSSAWEADCLRAILGLPAEWEGLDFLRFIDVEDELGLGEDSIIIFLSFIERSVTIGQGLGHPAHEMIHRLLAGSDFGPACGIALDAESEKKLVELIFRAPRCTTPAQERSALFSMWESLWAATENGTLSGLASPKATAALFAAHAQLTQPLSSFPAPGFGHPAAALFTERSEPEPDDFPACLNLLRAEGWRMSPESFTQLACSLGGLGPFDADRRARNLAEVARADPDLTRAEILGLPLAYHLNTARSSIIPSPEMRGESALDWLFCKLCSLGMNPLDVWPARDPALICGSALIRAEVEHALLLNSTNQGTNSCAPLAGGSRRTL